MSNKALSLSLVLMPGLSPTWHAIPEHQPLGEINRIRSSRVRHELNGEERREPAGF